MNGKNTNISIPSNYNQDDDSGSDVEEIGQEDYYSNGPKTPKKDNVFSNYNFSQFKTSSPSSKSPNIPSFSQNKISPFPSDFDFESLNQQKQLLKNSPSKTSPKWQPPPPSQPPQIFQNSPQRPIPNPQGQNNPNMAISSLLHPSIKVPNYYTFQFQGYSVKFPYEKPYEAQKLLISSTLAAFKNGQNALLESPTGTGKSLALLSAALSFLETAPDITKLYYTSRTHIQLQQLVGELKKLPYFPQFSILASRRHLCLVPGVYQSNSPDYECRLLIDSEDGCPYNKPNANKTSGDIEDMGMIGGVGTNSIPFEFTYRGTKPKFDIDDLKNYGKTHNMCPYNLAFNIYHASQFVFCPYNYILKANDDKNLLLDFPKNATIAIFDEGHNIEGTAREDASLSLTYKQVYDSRHAAQYVPHDDTYKNLHAQVQKIQTDIINFLERKRREYDIHFNSNNNINNNSNNNNRPKYLTGESFRSVFVTIGENFISSVGVQMYNWMKVLGNTDKNDRSMFRNDIIISFFSACCDVFSVLNPPTFDFFKIVFVPDERGDKNKDEFRLLCLRPSFLFDKINRKTRSIIIASGTLSPLESFAAELESTFPIRVSAPHVVDASQVMTLSINTYQNIHITSRFSSLQAHGQEIYSALSHILYETLKVVPGGSLLFAPSYYTKDSIIREWRASNMYNQISSIKPIVEEKSNLPAPVIIKEYISHENGALLIGVCRGKISEGLDFSDDLSRIVYVFGIPYPGFKEADVELKMKYNDMRHCTNKSYLSGQEWYNCQAFRALFQSVGRCLRHTSDYGAIVFLDERIEANIEKLPTWLKMNLHKSMTVDQAGNLLQSFYRQMKARFPRKNNLSSPLLSQNISSQNFSGFQLSNVDDDDANTKCSNNYFNSKNSYSPNLTSPNLKSKFDMQRGTNNSYSPSSKSFNSSTNFDIQKDVKSTYNNANSNNTSNYKNSYSQNVGSSNSSSNYDIQGSTKFNSFSQMNMPSSMNKNFSNSFEPASKLFNYNDQKSIINKSPTIRTNNNTKNTNSFNFNDSKNSYDFNTYIDKADFSSSFDKATKPSDISQSLLLTNAPPRQKAKSEYSPIVKQESKKQRSSSPIDVKSEKEKSVSNLLLTDMFCSSCGSLVIRIKDLDQADFKTITNPEFIQLLGTKERRVKIMFLGENAIHTDLTKPKNTVQSETDLCVFTSKECPKCGKPLAAYVSVSEDGSQFKRGELLFRQDVISMNFQGKLMSLLDIANIA